MPLAHGVQVEAEVAPVAVEEEPAGHSLQPSPATSAYWPAGHEVHDVDPAAEPVPAPHGRHCASAAENVAALCVSAGHGRHSRAPPP